MRDFKIRKLKLLEIGNKSKLRIPKSIRAQSAPWAGKYLADLPTELQERFEGTEITVFEIGSDAHPDEIRDLFIRLQSGTALSRQQIRDAWPGNLGPFVERLAGKLDKHATHKLFTVIDKRGQRFDDEEQRDYHVADRQTCAQLLKVFLVRERDPYAFPSVSANELDAIYHEYTDFDSSGPAAEHFKSVLSTASEVFEKVKAKLGKKAKFRRLDVTVTMMYIQDVSKGDGVKFDKKAVEELAKLALEIQAKEDKPSGKSTAGSTLQGYYTWWRAQLPKDIVVRLDPKRAFDSDQKKQLRERDGGNCTICGEEVAEDQAEYDHFPIPHRDGGYTVVENGRLVHRGCHPRGRPSDDD